MIITLNLATEPVLQLKFATLRKDLIFIQSYFQDRMYGESVNEIAGSLVCTTSFQLQFIGIGKEYSKRKKLISFLSKIEMDWVEQNDEPTVNLACRRLLIETFKEFEAFGIKGFDTAKFIEDFEDYLSLVENKSLEELQAIMPVLNEETLRIHEKKWKRFLSS